MHVEALARRGEVGGEHRACDRGDFCAHAQHVGGIARLGHRLDLGTRGVDDQAVELPLGGLRRLESHDADSSGIGQSAGVVDKHGC
jgi:hypothetical protein